MSDDILQQLSSHQNKWVALNKTRTKILAFGSTIKELEKKIADKFKTDDIVVTKVLPKDRLYAHNDKIIELQYIKS